METKYNLLTRILKNLKTSVLPSGTAADAGKVATVGQTGEWGAVTPSGGSGGGVLVVHETEAQTELGTTYTLDATYADIASAVAACIVREVNEHGLLSQRISYVDTFYSATDPNFETMCAVHFSFEQPQKIYTCEDPNDYPVYIQSK